MGNVRHVQTQVFKQSRVAQDTIFGNAEFDRPASCPWADIVNAECAPREDNKRTEPDVEDGICPQPKDGQGAYWYYPT